MRRDALAAWTRLSRDEIAPSESIAASEDGLSLVAAHDARDGSGPVSSAHFAEDLREAADQGYLATSDDPLYLISPGDVVEVCVPAPDASSEPSRFLVQASYSAPADGSPGDPHAEAAIAFSEASLSASHGPGAMATAIMVPDPAGGPPLQLLRRPAFPGSEWSVPGQAPCRDPFRPAPNPSASSSPHRVRTRSVRDSLSFPKL